jgi:predicted membrane GTPase involved in stress response
MSERSRMPLTNIRVAFKEQTVVLKTPRLFTLEAVLEYIEDNELVEITPKSVRLRKRRLSENDRKRFDRSARDKALRHDFGLARMIQALHLGYAFW